jgi:hypothetical protein
MKHHHYHHHYYLSTFDMAVVCLRPKADNKGGRKQRKDRKKRKK